MCGTEELPTGWMNLRDIRFIDGDPSDPNYRGRDYRFNLTIHYEVDRNSDNDTSTIS